MKHLISQGLLLFSEIGVIVVMFIIIARERKKRKAEEKRIKRSAQHSAAPKTQTLYLD
ncbi:MAG: hypothetical protein PVF09_00260 [Desulfobacterales bacterium]|jgi:hypothetical protein|nr:hypothetical protein [Deltaproteobacteria bacterium]